MVKTSRQLGLLDTLRAAIQADKRSLRVIAAEAGTTASSLSRFVRGERTVSADVLDRLASVLGVYSSMDKNLLAIPTLEVPCRHCGGTGGEDDGGKWWRCGFCEGAGYMTTDAGEAIVALMRHNFRAMLEDAQA